MKPLSDIKRERLEEMKELIKPYSSLRLIKYPDGSGDLKVDLESMYEAFLMQTIDLMSQITTEVVEEVIFDLAEIPSCDADMKDYVARFNVEVFRKHYISLLKQLRAKTLLGGEV